MRINTTIGLAILLAGATAGAQPVTSPASCAVRIARAPDDVRAVVEDWISAEPRCSTALEVRIIPTDGGLYILAQDEHGRTRERIVPDAQSAGVLIASWVADDAMYVPRPVPVLVWPRVGGVEVQQQPERPPSAVIGVTREDDNVSKWVGLSFLIEPRTNDGGGLRADIDILTRGSFTLGVAGSSTANRIPISGSDVQGEMQARDFKLVANASHTWQTGRWFARTGGGLGAVHTSAVALLSPNSNWVYGFVQGSGWFPTAEASAAVGVELGRNWAFSAGPLVSLYSQEFHTQTTMYTYQMQQPVDMARHNLELLMFGALKYRL